MNKDLLVLLHPFFAVVVVFPLIGVVVNRAWQVRQRRLQTLQGKSKIPPVVGQEHVQLGRWLTGAVVGIVLLALAVDISGNILDNQVWGKEPFKVALIGLIFSVAISSLVLLYQAKPPLWRGIFATLTGMALVVLGCQDGIYRKTDQWYISHYYYGMTAALLMIFSLAIVQNIYQDRKNRWRNVHIAVSCLALLLFLGQGITGTRDLLEVPLSWQEPYVQKLYEQQCEMKPCTIQAPAVPQAP
jgi:cytosine/uracil/thiamine/allantoin permease